MDPEAKYEVCHNFVEEKLLKLIQFNLIPHSRFNETEKKRQAMTSMSVVLFETKIEVEKSSSSSKRQIALSVECTVVCTSLVKIELCHRKNKTTTGLYNKINQRETKNEYAHFKGRFSLTHGL